MQQHLKTAIELYKRAAQAGNKQAKSLLTSHSKGKHTRSVGKLGICISHCIFGFVTDDSVWDLLLMSQDSSDNIYENEQLISLLSPLPQKMQSCAPYVQLHVSL